MYKLVFSASQWPDEFKTGLFKISENLRVQETRRKER